MNYDELMIGMDPDFYRNLNERINDIDDSLYVLTAVAGAINTGKARSLDLSPESGIVRKILAGNNDPAPICLLRHIVFRHSTYDEKVLVVFVVNDKNISLGLKSLAEAVFNEFECVSGALVNFNSLALLLTAYS